VGTNPTLKLCLGGVLLANIEEKTEKLLEGKISELGYELYDIEYVKEGQNYYLRVYIDNENGINLEDCEKVSNGIDDILDEANYIKEQYFLEVSSPGIERVLRKNKHLEKYIGEEIEIKLFKPINKQKQYIGILENFDNENIKINVNEEILEISRKDISQIKTIYNW